MTHISTKGPSINYLSLCKILGCNFEHDFRKSFILPRFYRRLNKTDSAQHVTNILINFFKIISTILVLAAVCFAS